MDKLTQHIIELFKEHRYSEVEGIPTNIMLKVDSNEVTRIIKKNYSYLDCTCESSGKTGHNSFCRHKQFFVIFPILKLMDSKLDKLIKEYKFLLDSKLNTKVENVLHDLESLKKCL